MSGSDDYVLGVVPCRIVDGDERVGAIYLSGENRDPPYLLLASYTVLYDTAYAGFTLLHEVAHHVGFDDDLADFIAVLVMDKDTRRSLLGFLEEPPMIVQQAINEAARNYRTCDVRDLKRLLEDMGFIRVRRFSCSDA